MSTRLLVLGGYLGAGKTTLAVNLAKIMKLKHNKNTAIITNDQGDVLVDTEYARDSGFNTREIMGGCFCTNFDNFVANARDLVSTGKPDVIIAEPIGSSTNIMGSVVAPMRTMYPDEFSVSPFIVAVDCVRALDILKEVKDKDIDTVDLIPAHQIRDAEIVVLTKTDLVNNSIISEIKNLINKSIANIEIIETSSMDLRNIEDIISIILSDKTSVKAPIAENNIGFAFEKAKLGWYSGTYDISPNDEIDMYSLATDLMKGVASEYGAKSIVHVKVSIKSKEAACKMSLVQEHMQVDGIYGSRFMKSAGQMVLNARIISPPKKLEATMRSIVSDVAVKHSFSYNKINEKCFMPKPESPSHFLFE